MYLFLPKDGCDAGTPVAPEEKNIVDMPAMDFCCSNPSPQSEVFSCSLLCTLEFFAKAAFREKCQQPSSGLL